MTKNVAFVNNERSPSHNYYPELYNLLIYKDFFLKAPSLFWHKIVGGGSGAGPGGYRGGVVGWVGIVVRRQWMEVAGALFTLE